MFARFIRLVATESSGGFHARFLQAAWMEGGFFYRVMTWHPMQDSKKAMKALPAALACIRVLPPADARRIGKEIRAMPDPEADVGLHYSLRGGVCRDYAFGIEWEKPARGWWSVAAGQQARERVEGAEAGLGESVKFSAVEKSSGVLLGISLERHAGSDAKPFEGKLAGRKARCRRKPVGEQVCEIRMLTVRNTAYVLLTAGKKDDGFELAGEFRVLDR